MEITFTKLDDDSCRFHIGPVSPSFANTLRRAMIGEVPTLAIEDVRIYDNTSALFDEMLAHRLGLIPIRTDSSAYVKKEECSCGGEGCAACTATFTMSVEGPGMVYSRDLIPRTRQRHLPMTPSRSSGSQKTRKSLSRHMLSSRPEGSMPSGSPFRHADIKITPKSPSGTHATAAASASTNARERFLKLKPGASG